MSRAAPTSQLTHHTLDVNAKADDNRIEDVELDDKHIIDKVNDSEAAPYVDHTIVIDAAENKRLKRMIDRR
jgi:hypothetical protein